VAKVTLVFEDRLDGGVMVTCTPRAEELIQAVVNNHSTPAHTYALNAINSIREMSKAAGSKIIRIPKVK